MDDQPIREIEKNKDAMRRAFAGVGSRGAAEPETVAGLAGAAIDEARTLVRDVGERINEATTTVRNVGEQAWSAASDAGATAQDLAREARDQAAAASDALYKEGARAGEYLRRNVNDYPLTAVLIAGAIGYLTAYLMHTPWRASIRQKDTGIDR